MLRPAIDSCGLKINFFYSDLRRPSQLQQSKPPVTSVNKPLCKKGKYHLLLTSCLFSLNSAVVWSNPTVQWYFPPWWVFSGQNYNFFVLIWFQTPTLCDDVIGERILGRADRRRRQREWHLDRDVVGEQVRVEEYLRRERDVCQHGHHHSSRRRQRRVSWCGAKWHVAKWRFAEYDDPNFHSVARLRKSSLEKDN